MPNDIISKTHISKVSFSSPIFFKEYNVRVASRYFKGPELLVDYQMYDYRFVLSVSR